MSIIDGKSDKSFDEFNICMFCLKQNFRDLAVWPCFSCLKDFPAMYKFPPHFTPFDKLDEIEKINGPDVWQYDRFAQAEKLAREDKSSKTGLGCMDKPKGPFNKGIHTKMPCNSALIQYWHQILINS